MNASFAPTHTNKENVFCKQSWTIEKHHNSNIFVKAEPPGASSRGSSETSSVGSDAFAVDAVLDLYVVTETKRTWCN